MCLRSSTNYYVLYFDINKFKSYNDVYGYENGDRLIKCLAKLLKDHVQKTDFIGHIGGDDFIAILSDSNPKLLCEKIIRQFDAAAQLFFNKNDLDKGYIIALNRNGIEEKFPLLSISIAVTSSCRYKSIYDLSENLAKLKHACKQHQGSSYLIEP